MKVIDLLNQIANGEAPKKIKVNKNILNLKIGKGTSYEFETGGGMLSFDYYIENNKLDTIVEIIEEKKIPEKLDYIHPDISCSYNESELLLRIVANKDKINSIINNKEYQYSKSNGYFIIAYDNYTSKTEYEEYYILWQNTEKGLEKVKLENKNVYLIENNNEKPRIEYYDSYETNKNGVEREDKEDFYYQIYIPENAIDYSYKLN